MSLITQIISRIQQGDAVAAEQLLPLVYDDLRILARQKMAHESPGHTLQATALVHQAYLRLVDVDQPQQWAGRGHFFAAAAEAMRRILVEAARYKSRMRHGGEFQRVELPADPADQRSGAADHSERLIELDAVLRELETEDALSADVVKLHFFAGQSLEEVARLLGLSRASAYRQWAYARSWLKCKLKHDL